MGSVEPAEVERRRWPASLVVSGVLALLVAVVGWIGVAAWLSSAAHPRSGEWRTEQFRDITFRVPVEWGYASEPGLAWCGDTGRRDPQLRPDQQRPYISLGFGNLDLLCPGPPPDALISEHVAAQSADMVRPSERDAGVEQKSDGRYRLARGFWEIIRTVGTVKVRVVSRNLDLAGQIAGSAAPTGADEECRPTVDRPTDRGPRPDPAFDVRELDSVRSITLCQYDSGLELRARAVLGEAEAGRLIRTIAASPVERDAACPPDPPPIWWELVVLIHLRTADGDNVINVYVRTCGADNKQIRGGFDDGTTVRMLTRENCRSVLPQPLGFDSGHMSVHDLCVP